MCRSCDFQGAAVVGPCSHQVLDSNPADMCDVCDEIRTNVLSVNLSKMFSSVKWYLEVSVLVPTMQSRCTRRVTRLL